MVSVAVAALATTSVGNVIAGGLESAVCRIVGGDCSDQAQPVQRLSGDGPALARHDIAILPFPGSYSVNCGHGEANEHACKPEGTGVSAQGEITAERSPTTLDGEGCPQQTVSLDANFRVEAGLELGEEGKATGRLGRYTGHSSTYAITAGGLPGRPVSKPRGGVRQPEGRRAADGLRGRLGHETRGYALNLEGVDPRVYSDFQALNGGDTRPPDGGNVRMEFSGADLMGIRRQALEHIAFQMERAGVEPPPTPEEVADNLERNHGTIKYGPHRAEIVIDPVDQSLAVARNPEEVLARLTGSGKAIRTTSSPVP